MAVYVFSLLVGYRHSGVDTAQGIRDKYLLKTKQPIQYIFTETPDQRSMEVYTGMNIAAEHMVSAHMWMAGIKHLGGNYPLADMVQELTVRLDSDKCVREGNEIHLYKNEQKKATIFLKTGSEYVSRVMYYNSSKLLAEEY